MCERGDYFFEPFPAVGSVRGRDSNSHGRLTAGRVVKPVQAL